MLKKILNDINEMIGRYENSYHLSVAKKKESKILSIGCFSHELFTLRNLKNETTKIIQIRDWT